MKLVRPLIDWCETLIQRWGQKRFWISFVVFEVLIIIVTAWLVMELLPASSFPMPIKLGLLIVGIIVLVVVTPALASLASSAQNRIDQRDMQQTRENFNQLMFYIRNYMNQQRLKRRRKSTDQQ